MGACISSNYCRNRARQRDNSTTRNNCPTLSPLESQLSTTPIEIVVSTTDLNQNQTETTTITPSATTAINPNTATTMPNHPITSNITSNNNNNNNNYLLSHINNYSTYGYYVPPTGKNKRLKKDSYKYFKCDKKISEAQLQAKRDEFWHTAPHFDGKGEIWAALKAAVDACETKQFTLAQAIIDSANIILPNGLLSDCYDELGNRYQLPIYVLAKPANLVGKKHATMDDGDSTCSSTAHSKSKNNNYDDYYDDTDENSNKNVSNAEDEDLSSTDTTAHEQQQQQKKNQKSQHKRNSLKNKFKIFKFSKSTSKKTKSNCGAVSVGKVKIDNNKHNKDKIVCNLDVSEEMTTATPVKTISIKMRVSSMNNEEEDIKLEINLQQTVLSLKHQVNKLTNIDISQQRLFFRGKLMKDNQRLRSHKLYKGVVLQCIVREAIEANEVLLAAQLSTQESQIEVLPNLDVKE